MPKAFAITDIDYAIRYMELDSNLIYNYCKDRYLNFEGEFPEKFQKIEKSVLEEGFRNPILVTIGQGSWIYGLTPEKLHEDWREDPDNLLMCDKHGGNRLAVAQRNKLKIPCIVSDFVNRFPDHPRIESMDELRSLFKDRPRKIKLWRNGVHLEGLK